MYKKIDQIIYSHTTKNSPYLNERFISKKRLKKKKGKKKNAVFCNLYKKIQIKLNVEALDKETLNKPSEKVPWSVREKPSSYLGLVD